MKLLFSFFISLFLTTTLFSTERVSLVVPILQDGREVITTTFFPDENNSRNSTILFGPLKTYLKHEYIPDFVRTLEKLEPENDELTLLDLEKFGVFLIFDEASLAVTLQIAPEYKKRQLLNLGIYTQARDESVTYYPPEEFSTYLNIRPTLERRASNKTPTDYSRALHLQSVTQFKKTLFETGIDYKQSSHTTTTQLEDTSYTVFFDTFKRLKIGDTDVRTMHAQSFSSGVGIIFSSESDYFSLFDPRFNQDKKSFLLTRPSEIKVLLNGVLIHTDNYPAGPVDISHYPVVSGQNDLEIIAKDDLGVVKSYKYGKLFNPDLLPVGKSEYRYHLMRPTKNSDDAFLSDYSNKTLFTLFHRYGLSSHLSTAVNFQTYDSNYLYGVEFVRDLPYLLANSEFSLLDHGVRGVEGEGRFKLSTHYSNHRELLPFSAQLLFALRSLAFSGPMDPITHTPYTSYLSGVITKRLEFSSSLSAGLSYYNNHHNPDSYRPSMTFTKSFFKGGLQSSLTFDRNFDKRENETRAFISLTYIDYLTNTQLNSFYDTQSKVTSIAGNKNGVNSVGSYSTSATGTNFESGKSGALSYTQESRFLNSSVSHTGSTSNDYSQSNTRFNLGTALLYTSHTFALAPPINSSFAIVKMIPPLQDRQLEIGKTTNSRRGLIGKFPAVIQVPPFAEEKIRIDTTLLKDGEEIDHEELGIISHVKSGTLITVNFNSYVTLTTYLLDEKNSPLSYLSGDWTSDTGLKGRFFTNKQGRLYLDQLKNGLYTITFDNQMLLPMTFSLNSSNQNVLLPNMIVKKRE